MVAISINNISKVYNNQNEALSNVSFSIPQGEIFGFLGPNGAGKTTMVRLLNGVLSPTGGTAHVLDLDVTTQAPEIHKISGILTETAAPYESLTGLENLNFFANLHEMDDSAIKERSEYLLKTLGLFDHKDNKVKTYSTGMKKKLLLARALLHRPKLLFLDEPTSGLDPEASSKVNLLLKELVKNDGVTVFLCTHQLKYAEEICTLYGFLHKGNLLGFGAFDELLKKKGCKTYLELRGERIPEIKGLEKLDNKLRIQISNDLEASEILNQILSKGGKVFEAKHTQWSLEELYFSYQEDI